jgi:hypothetical protein
MAESYTSPDWALLKIPTLIVAELILLHEFINFMALYTPRNRLLRLIAL